MDMKKVREKCVSCVYEKKKKTVWVEETANARAPWWGSP